MDSSCHGLAGSASSLIHRKIAKSFSNLNLVKKNKEISPAAYKAPIKAYRDIINDIQKVCHGSPTGTIFASAPPSFPKFVKRQKNNSSVQPSSHFEESSSANSNNNPERTNLRTKLKKKGWVISTGRYQWPSTLQCKTICNKFAQLHSACMDGASCAYEHRSFPQDFSDSDRKTIYNFVQDHPALTFTPNISWCPPATTSSSTPKGSSLKRSTSFSNTVTNITPSPATPTKQAVSAK